MVDCKISSSQSFYAHQGHGKRIAYRERDSCTGRWRQVQRTSFFVNRSIQNGVGTLSQSGVEVSDYSYDRDLAMSQIRQNLNHFIGFAAVAQGNHDIVRSYDTQTAVSCVRGMQVKRRGPGAGQRSRNFLGDDSRFSDSEQYNLAFAVRQQIDGLLDL